MATWQVEPVTPAPFLVCGFRSCAPAPLTPISAVLRWRHQLPAQDLPPFLSRGVVGGKWLPGLACPVLDTLSQGSPLGQADRRT